MATSAQKIIQEKSRFLSLFDKQFNERPIKEQVLEILDQIESDLSPENLCCDGELPATQVSAKWAKLTREQKTLKEFLGTL